MIPAWLGVVLALLGFGVGVLSSFVTIGRQVERALVQLADLTRRVDRIENDAPSPSHSHRYSHA